MSHWLTPTALYTGSFKVPDPGDFLVAADTDLPLQSLLNNTLLLSQSQYGMSSDGVGNIYFDNTAEFVKNGSGFDFTNGSYLDMNGNVTVEPLATIHWNNNATASFASNATANLLGNTNLNGQTCIIADNYLPSFATPQTITKVQPLIVVSTDPFTANVCNSFTFQDGGNNSYIYDIPCTRFINAATCTAFTMQITTAGTAPTSADATAIMYRVDHTTNPPGGPTALATITIPTGLGNLSSYSYTATLGTPEVMNEHYYTYFIRIRASSTQPLYWYSPTLSITNIRYLGQF